ncbi:MAG: 50S ribosomal protein L5 [Acidobacteria bacterium]|nr:50S ribosomal protein L5 [Acidobacteriota bacterium]MCG2816923.1 50S ribosomal protein L5 [Candidatus Aminicenantes bacterium]MBU4202837.1 50S ribosomal protein L5 [Acidobacteriota bacterium]MBU4255264.1 50S ribosomal protein L5 [Acidobacteriota bacterium]MBU4329100.1 50S ribosomal protein L5 [Acidobacteriota bacterium]
MSRLQEKYNNEYLAELQEELSISNKMAVPRLKKIIVNVGVGEANQNIKLLDTAQQELSLITGQWPAIGRAKKSISQFKLRQGQPIACYVTLRGKRMYEFMDRLVNVILPRVRDFRGVPSRAFDGRGNYTMGMKEQLVFPEIDYTKVERPRGMNITVVTSAKTDKEAYALLKKLGMPFTDMR